MSPGRDREFKEVSQERWVYSLEVGTWSFPADAIHFRAFADFCAASVVLHLFTYNFLG